MTPKEKAEELVLIFTNLINYDFVSDLQWHDANNSDRNTRVKKDAKKCSLIVVDQIIRNGGTKNMIEYQPNSFTNNIQYWKEVKQEIEKI